MEVGAMVRKSLVAAAFCLAFSQGACGDELPQTQWVIIDQILAGDVPSISLLTDDQTWDGRSLIFGEHGECETYVYTNFNQKQNFFVMNDPGFYHASFTFDEDVDGHVITRLLACVAFNQ